MKQEAYEPHHSPKHLFVHHSFSKCLSIKLFKSTVKLSYIPKLDNTLNKLHKEAYFFFRHYILRTGQSYYPWPQHIKDNKIVK